jgi:hypothetical protein
MAKPVCCCLLFSLRFTKTSVAKAKAKVNGRMLLILITGLATQLTFVKEQFR